MRSQTNILALPDRRTESEPVIGIANRNLAEASRLVEAAAYLIAGEISSDRVAQLMLIAADIERLSEILERSGIFHPTLSKL